MLLDEKQQKVFLNFSHIRSKKVDTKINPLKKISKRPNFWGLFLSFSEVGFLFLGEKRGSVHSQLLSENDKSPNR
jgi:hypothetical protein